MDEDEAAPNGASIHLGGLAYTPQITRQLNPRITPDQALIGGRRAGDGRLWLGAPPILLGTQPAADPLPQALVLTAIVIGFGMSAFIIELALRARQDTGSDHVDGTEPEEKR